MTWRGLKGLIVRMSLAIKTPMLVAFLAANMDPSDSRVTLSNTDDVSTSLAASLNCLSVTQILLYLKYITGLIYYI